MTAITNILGTDIISTSRTDINTNFENLNDDKIETSVISTDNTFASASDAKIPSQLAVKTYVDASVNPTGRSWNEYAADAGSTDSYAITVSGVSAYVTGQTFKFKANTANTGACTLNVSALGAKTIKKDVTTDLATGDILANQIVTVIYDGTNMQMVSAPSGIVIVPATNVQTFTSSGTYTKPAGTPLKVFVQAWGGGGSGGKGNYSGGGGGGAYVEYLFDVATVGATETVTIGDGGAAKSTTADGDVGGNSTFGSLLTAYGGGGGSSGTIASSCRGGGGGGALGVGATDADPALGGSPSINAAGGIGYTGLDNIDGGAGGGVNTLAGGNSVRGGGGGGGNSVGGNSVYGGGGGGGDQGRAGGTSRFGGAGGAGVDAGAGGVAGSVPGGGGGATNTGTASGAGGKGKIIVTTYY
jgi:hypothetical protein